MNFDSTKLLNAMQNEFSKYPNIEKVVLFGSRARGDNSERSDYDLAIYGYLSQNEMSAIRSVFNEELPTLHKIDLVFMQEKLLPAFIKSIETEGVKIYG